MQIGPQRCLFLCSIEQTLKEICTFRMGGFAVRVPFSLFWVWFSSKVVYKIIKNPNLHISQVVYKNKSIPRRHSDIKENFGKNNLWDLPVTKCRICYKPKEISSSAKTENKFLGITIDSVAASGENRFDFEKVSRYVVNQEVPIK